MLLEHLDDGVAQLLDLLAALKSYPETRQPGSDSEKIYLAALLLAIGKVGETEYGNPRVLTA